MTPAYFDALDKQAGRPYQELKAAAAAMSGQRIVCIHPEGCQPASSQRVQQLPAVELRKAFVTKPQVPSICWVLCMSAAWAAHIMRCCYLRCRRAACIAYVHRICTGPKHNELHQLV